MQELNTIAAAAWDIVVLGLLLAWALSVLSLAIAVPVLGARAGVPWWQMLVPGLSSWQLARVAHLPGWVGLVQLALGIGALTPAGPYLAVPLLLVLGRIGIGLAMRFGRPASFAILIAIVPNLALPYMALRGDRPTVAGLDATPRWVERKPKERALPSAQVRMHSNSEHPNWVAAAEAASARRMAARNAV